MRWNDSAEIAPPHDHSLPELEKNLTGSRYWPYTAEDLLDIARGYAEHAVPLDVLVSDMAWHYHGEDPVEWGGYSWGKQLFPAPAHLLKTVAAAGLNLTLNLHLGPINPAEEDPAHCRTPLSHNLVTSICSGGAVLGGQP